MPLAMNSQKQDTLPDPSPLEAAAPGAHMLSGNALKTRALAIAAADDLEKQDDAKPGVITHWECVYPVPFHSAPKWTLGCGQADETTVGRILVTAEPVLWGTPAVGTKNLVGVGVSL